VSDLARFPWVFYQHDRDVMTQLSSLFQRSGARPPGIRVETTSLHAVMQLLRSGPYLACIADAYLRAAPEPQVAILPYPHAIWTFPAGVQVHTALRDFAPIRMLVDLIADEAGLHAPKPRRRKA
jgi:DNA-binding transcriptional LysR family regulator